MLNAFSFLKNGFHGLNELGRQYPRAARFLIVLLCLGYLIHPDQGFTDTPELDFERYELDVSGRLADVTYEDLDGDGKVDVLVTRGREIMVFFQEDKGFNTKPHQRWKFDRRAVIFDTVALVKGGPRAIAFIGPDGVFTYDLKGRKYRLLRRRVLKCQTLTSRASSDEIRRKDFCRDLNNDGVEDLLIPEATGLGLYFNDGKGKFAARRELFCPPSARVDPGFDRLSSRALAVYWFSNPCVTDFNRDGKMDVMVADNDLLKVYFQNKDGQYSKNPDQLNRILGIKLLQSGQRPDFELDLTTPVLFDDINNDGYVDLLSTHIGKGLTRIFMGSAEGMKAYDQPTQSIRAKGVAFFPFMVDIDGDGKKDLIVPKTDKIGIWSILKVLVTRTVPVEVLFFYHRGDSKKPYGDDPDFVREIEIPITLRSTGDRLDVGTAFLATVNADFNADGTRDVLYRVADDTLGIFNGHRDRRAYAADPDYKVTVRNMSDYRVMMADVPDLNGDGVSDIVLKYYSWDRSEDRLTVMVSKRK